MASGNTDQLDIEEIVASFSQKNPVVAERNSSNEETDSADEIEIVKELKVSLVDHQCDLCCEGSFLMNKLLKFGGVINNSKKHGCEVCCKGFSNKQDLSKHMELHLSGELNSDAEIEPQTIVSSNRASESSVICDICTLPFKSLLGLRRHINNQHSKDSQTHMCTQCMATFKTTTLYKRHCLTHRKSDMLYTCCSCKEIFSSLNHLKDHICGVE